MSFSLNQDEIELPATFDKNRVEWFNCVNETNKPLRKIYVKNLEDYYNDRICTRNKVTEWKPKIKLKPKGRIAF